MAVLQLAGLFVLACIGGTHGTGSLRTHSGSSTEPTTSGKKHTEALASCSNPPCPLPNIGYLGSGYDLIQGNPLATGTVDPGFMVASPFDLGANGYHLSPDRSFLLPNGTTLHNALACQLDFESSSVYSAEDYQSSLRESVSVSSHFFFASFSGSHGFQRVKQSTQKSLDVYALSQAICQVYYASLNVYSPPKLSDNFLAAVKGLPKKYNSETSQDYHRFIQVFGTHVVEEMLMGAKFGQQSKFSYSDYGSFMRSGSDFSASASASAFIAGVSSSFLSDKQKKEAQQFIDAATSQEEFTVGSRPPSDGKMSTWASSAKLSPMPLQYSLTPISDLLTERYFPTLSNLDSLRSNVVQALTDYCHFLQSQGIDASCEGLPKPPTRSDPYISALQSACEKHFNGNWRDKCGCGNGPYCRWESLTSYLGFKASEKVGCPLLQTLTPGSPATRAYFLAACKNLNYGHESMFFACVSDNCSKAGTEGRDCLGKTARDYIGCPSLETLEEMDSNLDASSDTPIPTK